MKRIFVLLACASVAIATIGQTADSLASHRTMELSLEQAREYAIRNNRTLANANLDVRKAYAQRWQTIAQMLPQVDAKLDYSNMCGYEIQLNQGFKIPMNPSGTISITAAIALNGQMIVGALLNNLSIEMQDINAKNSELNVVSQVDIYYITALAMQRTVDLLDQAKVNLENLHNITQHSVEVGVVEAVQADQLQVQVASMRSTINSTRRSLELIYNSLALQLALGDNVKIVLTDKLDDLLNEDLIAELVRTDFNIDNNYNYQLAQKNVELSKRNLLMSWMAYVPTVSAYYQYSAKTYFGKDAGMNMTPPNVVGVSVSVPLWSSGKRAAAITEKKIAIEEAQNTLDDARDGLLLQLKQLRYNLSTALEDFETQKLNIEVSQRVFDNTSSKFEYGRASALEITNASTTLITAQSEYVQSVLTMVQAQIELRKLLNKK